MAGGARSICGTGWRQRGREPARVREEEIAAADRAGWLPRMLPKTFSRRPAGAATAAVGALIRGYELGIERLDQTLDEFKAREIRASGRKLRPAPVMERDRQRRITHTVAPGTLASRFIEAVTNGMAKCFARRR